MVTLRRQEGNTRDVMIVAPANGPARVIDKGQGLHEGTYTIAMPTDKEKKGSGACSIYGQSGSGGGALISATITKDSGTPYTVATFSVVTNG